MIWWFDGGYRPWYVDVVERKLEIAEAERRQAADADSRVLRVKGKVPVPMFRVPAIVTREKL